MKSYQKVYGSCKVLTYFVVPHRVPLETC